MADAKWNIVFILTDDQGPWAAGCYGNPEIRTPHLDRLAGTGVRLENFFCTSPVCSPARASLLTGRLPSQHGVHDWIRERNMPPGAAAYLEGATCTTDILAENGYTCGLSGKWHLGDSLQPQHGFTHWFTIPTGGSRYNDAEVIRNGQVEVAPGYLSDVITDDALGFLEAHAKDPFYLSLHFTAPHSPWDGHPQDIVDSYDDCPFKSCPQEAAHSWLIPSMRPHLGNRESLKGYFAAVTAMDRNVGRVLDTLESLRLRERTLVVFTSDNGFSCGHHGFWGKGNGTFPLNMYENSVRVPMIFSHPGALPAGELCTALMSQYDVMPTLLDYAAIDAPPDPTLPGVSFLPVLKGEQTAVRDEVVVYDEYGPVRMIRTREWKYIHRYPFGPHELYHLAEDPDERTNLIDAPEHGATRSAMLRQMGDWFARYVRPECDGVRLPVTGRGQLDRLGDATPDEEAFAPIP